MCGLPNMYGNSQFSCNAALQGMLHKMVRIGFRIIMHIHMQNIA